jgi:hypothetical protein
MDWPTIILGKYAKEVWYGRLQCRTPVNVSLKLVKGTEDSKPMNKEKYQSAVGSLLYLSSATRPDITSRLQ